MSDRTNSVMPSHGEDSGEGDVTDGRVKGPRMNYLDDHHYYMALAHLVAQRSRDPTTPVGTCIVSSDNKVAAVGFNKMPDGCHDHEFPWSEHQTEEKYNTKFPFVCHAELDAIMSRRSCHSLEGGSIYITLFPCNECAKIIIQAGIKEVIYASDKYRNTDKVYLMRASQRMMKAAGVKYRKFEASAQWKEVTITFPDEVGTITIPFSDDEDPTEPSQRKKMKTNHSALISPASKISSRN